MSQTWHYYHLTRLRIGSYSNTDSFTEHEAKLANLQLLEDRPGWKWLTSLQLKNLISRMDEPDMNSKPDDTLQLAL
jgi:hypothetical protein